MIRQAGFTIVMAIFVLVVLGLLASFMVRIIIVENKVTSDVLQGARAYQAARAGADWALSRIVNYSGSCVDVNAQTSITFPGLDGFTVKLICSSANFVEAEKNLTIYKVTSLCQFGDYESSDYVAREVAVSFVVN